MLNPPPPTLSSVEPDRAAPGKAITLFGENLGETGDRVEVLFEPGISVQVTPGGNSLTVNIPAEAKTGEIRVGVSHPGEDAQLSNSLPFQVVWEFLNLEPIFSNYDFVSWWYNSFSKGWKNGPDLVFSIRGRIGSFNSERVWGLGQDESQSLLTNLPLGYWKPRYNRVNGHWYHLYSANGSGNSVDLVDISTGEIIVSAPNPSQGSWVPRAFDFDSLGNLIIAADLDNSSLGLWRFAPGETVVLNPSSPAALIPGVASNWGWQGEIAIADDDTIYCVDGDNDPNPAGIWRIPGLDGSPYQRIQMPASSFVSNGYGYWYLGTDCMGEGYAINPCLLDEGCWSNFVLYRLGDLAPIATMVDTQDFLAMTSDRYANMYFETQGWDGSTWNPVLKRVLPEELPPGFYGYSLRSNTPENLPPEPPYQTPQLLAECRSDQPPAACSTPGLKRILQSLEIADTCRQRGDCRVDSERLGSLKSQSKRPMSRAVMCPVPGAGGHLALEVHRRDGSVHRYEETPAEVELSFGEKITFSALWIDPESPPAPVAVKWSPADAAPDWRSAHPVEEGSMKEVLFPDDVLLLFDENHPDADIESRQGQVVHTGTVRLNLTLSSVLAPDGEEHHFEADVAGAYAPRLGTTHNDYDSLINRFANAYGILPQVLKGLIDRESAGWDPLAYRFEPKAWDWGMIKDHLSANYYKDFRFEEPATSGVGEYAWGAWLGPDEIDARVHSRFQMKLGFFVGSGWECYGLNDVYLGQPVPAWNLIVGSNGIAGSDTGLQPCGVRHNWFAVTPSLKEWEETLTPPSCCESVTCRAARWFFNHRDYNAQTFLSASYGLAQIGYPTVFAGLKWRESDPEHRRIADILAPENNIYLGARWLVQQPGYLKFSYWKNQYQLKAHHNTAPVEKLHKTLACTYNGRYKLIGKRRYSWSGCDYAADVWNRSLNFTPVAP